MRARRRRQVHLKYRGKLNRAAVRRGMANELPIGPYLVMVAKRRVPSMRERLVAAYIGWTLRDEWEGMRERAADAMLDMMLYGRTVVPADYLRMADSGKGEP